MTTSSPVGGKSIAIASIEPSGCPRVASSKLAYRTAPVVIVLPSPVHVSNAGSLAAGAGSALKQAVRSVMATTANREEVERTIGSVASMRGSVNAPASG
ncbi:MAG TPA: hypothetical protein VF316_23645 [Polyangiaceae bacterium]